ncbi:MAG TPA: GAF domain-containing protein [Anaerolineales bacterium]|nr:GAF domain-containing protein [Anaerolineales bacterium]
MTPARLDGSRRKRGRPEGGAPSPGARPEALEAVRRVTEEAVLQPDLESLFQSIVRNAVDLIQGEGGGMYLVVPETRQVRCVVSLGTPVSAVGTVLNFGEGAAGTVAETGQPLNIRDYRTWPARAAVFEQRAPFRAVISAPMVWQGRVTGILHVLRFRSESAFNDADLRLLTVFANQAAVVLENARLLEAAERRFRQLSLLHGITRAGMALTELQPLVQEMADRMASLIEADACYLTLWDEGHRTVLPAAAFGTFRDTYPAMGPEPGEQTLTESVLKVGHPLAIDDVSATPYVSQSLSQRFLVRSALGLPLVVGETRVGAALLTFERPHAFTPEEINLCEQAAGQVALAIARVRALEAERRRTAELEGIRRASLRLTSSLELRPVLESVLEEALKLARAKDAHIFMYDGEKLAFGAAYWDGEFHPAPFSEPRPHGLTYSVARTGQRIIVADASTDPMFQDSPWSGTILGIPILAAGRVRGVMTMAFGRPTDLDQDELRALELLADQTAIALENARLFETIDTERRRLRLLFDITRELSASVDLTEILERAVRLTTANLDAEWGTAYLLDSQSGRLRLTATAGDLGMDVDSLDRILGMRTGRGLEGWVVAHRQSALVREVLQDERWLHLRALNHGPGSAITAPILTGQEILGVMTVLRSEVFQQEHLLLLEAVGWQVGLALANARRYQEVTRRLAERAALQNVAQTVNRRLEMEALLDEVVRQVSDVLGYPVVEIFLIEDDVLVLRAAKDTMAIGEKRVPIKRGVIGRAVRTNRPAYVPDVRQDPDYVVGVPTTVAEIAVPLYKEDLVVGVLNVETPERGRLTEEDLHLLTLLADQVSVALENAALYDRLRRNMAELEQTVSDRTAELAKALEQAREADRLKTQFVADVSHELRTPLTNIRLYLELVDRGRPEKFANYMETLNRETERLVSLIEDLLAVSRLDAGTAVPQPEPIDLNRLALGLVEDRRRLMHQKSLSLSYEPMAGLPVVMADERMLAQVLANLMTNAMNYTPPGGAIRISTDVAQDADGSWVRLSVADTGLGIPDDEKPNLFSRFFRGSASRLMNTSGTGLGLAICREILDRHGGRITFTSRTGEGTTFTIWLKTTEATPSA